MVVITRKSKGRSSYLAYNEKGNHIWSDCRLDAIRFSNRRDVLDCCREYLQDDKAKIKDVDEWDGYYTAYNGYEIQIFKDDIKGKPGGKRWRFRYSLQSHCGRGYNYSCCKRGYTTPQKALEAVKSHCVQLNKE